MVQFTAIPTVTLGPAGGPADRAQHRLRFPLDTTSPLSELGTPLQYTFQGTSYPCRRLLLKSPATDAPDQTLPQVLLLHKRAFTEIAKALAIPKPSKFGAFFNPADNVILVNAGEESPPDLSTLVASATEMKELQLTGKLLAYAIHTQNLPQSFLNIRAECEQLGLTYRADYAVRLLLPLLALQHEGSTFDSAQQLTDEAFDALFIHAARPEDAIATLSLLHPLDPSRFKRFAENLFVGSLPSGSGALPHAARTPCEDFAAPFVDEDSTPQRSDTKIHGATPVRPEAPRLPTLHPFSQTARDGAAHAVSSRERYEAQAARLLGLCHSPELEVELRAACPFSLPAGVRASSQKTAPQKGYPHIKWSYSRHGYEYTVRFHTKTADRNDEIPNFRLEKRRGRDTQYEALLLKNDPTLSDGAVQRLLDIQLHDDGYYWIPQVNIAAPGSLPEFRAKRLSGDLSRKIRLSTGGQVTAQEINDAIIRCGHVDYTPIGFELSHHDLPQLTRAGVPIW